MQEEKIITKSKIKRLARGMIGSETIYCEAKNPLQAAIDDLTTAFKEDGYTIIDKKRSVKQ